MASDILKTHCPACANMTPFTHSAALLCLALNISPLQMEVNHITFISSALPVCALCIHVHVFMLVVSVCEY